MITEWKTNDLWEAGVLLREGAIFTGIEPETGKHNIYLFKFQNDEHLQNAMAYLSSENWKREKCLLKTVNTLRKQMYHYRDNSYEDA